jgi:rare lipoprotein A
MMQKAQWGLVVLAVVGLALAGCSSSRKTASSTDPFAGIGSPYFKGKGKLPKGTGRYHVGQPYQVAGRWFTPKEQPGYDKTGPASWYGEAFNHRKTSNGEWFEMNDLTAAHPTLPLPSYAKVTNLQNGREIVVRINDRGPFVGPRIIDMSKRSAEVLGFKAQGKTTVRVQYLGPAPVQDAGQHLMAMNQQLGQGASVRQLARLAGQDNAIPSLHAGGVQEDIEPQQVQLVGEDLNPVSDQEFTLGYVINVASFSDPENAAAASNSLTQFGARLVPVDKDGEQLFRVVIGPLASQANLREALQAVHDAGFVDASVVSARIQQVSAN